MVAAVRGEALRAVVGLHGVVYAIRGRIVKKFSVLLFLVVFLMDGVWKIAIF